MRELMPCPFCGSEAKSVSAVRWLKPEWHKRKARGVYWFIGCTDPECILYLDEKTKNARLIFQSRKKDMMIRRWNRRDVRDAIMQEPTAQPSTGKWIFHTYMPHNKYCSCCEKDSPYNKMWNFCPNCGADMRGEQDG